ncbi:hypothetical protein [Enhygromyxa salina]|uniref:hypothetical protein n=1 Tax=Enhygromyxa salina TaxID=215803 RepID=UPI000D094904|nr:hypothetical protein [Enhygromyxa salina]
MNNPYQPPSVHADTAAPVHLPPGLKSRHGCLTAWLILMIIANFNVMLMHLLMSDQIQAATPDRPEWAIPVLLVIAGTNIVCTIGLFKWKKWGFWGFVVGSVIAGGINVMSDLSPAQSGAGLLGVLLLYGVMQIGEPSGWSQMD